MDAMDAMDVMWLAVLVVALAAAAVWWWRGRRPAAAKPAAPSPPARENYTMTTPSPPTGYALGGVPAPSSGSPLAPALAKALDALGPLDAGNGGESVPFTDDEIRGVLTRVVTRINARSQLDLILVSFDGVKKRVDAYKTLHYEAQATVHSPSKAYSSKVSVGVDVGADGRELVRMLRVHGAEKDTSPLGTASVGEHDRYATFEPAVRY
jgi:hypothetical protein